MREVVPLSKRRTDAFIIGFFWFNLLFVTYLFDLEQLVIRNPVDAEYPFWPPSFVIDLAHWWGRTFDPVRMARPAWWTMTAWIGVVFFGPFYAIAIHAFSRGTEWIRIPAVVYAGMMLANVIVVLGEEFFGATPAPYPFVVVAANTAWIVFPAIIIARMTSEHPFTRIVERQGG